MFLPYSHTTLVVLQYSVDIVCNECSVNADCNLNGVCKNDGKCECYNDEEGVTFIGPHCEVRLKDDCRTIYGGELIVEVPTWAIASDSLQFIILTLLLTLSRSVRIVQRHLECCPVSLG